MKIITPVNLIPDLVEELSIDESGAALDMTWLRLMLNEFDEHAIEQALLLKEQHGGHVTIIAPGLEGADDALYAAAAKGADQLITLLGLDEKTLNTQALAQSFATAIKDLLPDLVLTGVQAHNDLDGQLGPSLAELLGLPYVGYVAGVSLENGKVVVTKEYPGGLNAEIEVTLPAVLGIQASEKPPRYVAFSKIRQAKNTATIEELPLAVLEDEFALEIDRMYQPEVGERAEMLEGSIEDVAGRLMEIFNDQGVL